MSFCFPRVFQQALGTSVSTLCIGGMQFGWTANRSETFRLLDAFREAGGNFVDTADNYSCWAPGHQGGESERLIGEWLSGRKMRHQFVVATKVGYPTSVGNGLGRNHIRRSVEKSLRNLNLDCIPVYQLHRTDDQTPPEETVGLLADLQREGLIRAVGFCNMSASELAVYLRSAESVGLKNLLSYQVKFNFLERERLSDDLIRLANDYGLVLLVYGVLARGFLSGKYCQQFDPGISERAESVRKKYFQESSFRALDTFLGEAGKTNIAPARAAFEWVRHALAGCGVPLIAIGGFNSVEQFREATGIKRRLRGKALANYLNYRNAACVGGDLAYRPLLEELKQRHSEPPHPIVHASLPELRSGNGPTHQPAITALLQDVLSAATGGRWWKLNGLLTQQQQRVLETVARLYRKKLYNHLCLATRPEDLYETYARLRGFLCGTKVPGINRVLTELEAALQFYGCAEESSDHLRYQDFSSGWLETLVQPSIDCCLFNGRSRHRAATVVFLTHPAVRLMALYSTRENAAVGATIEVDMIDDQGQPIRVIDSVEIGNCRNRLGLRYGWKELIVEGVLRRAAGLPVFFNTGFEPRYNRGYLSHPAARELAMWLKQKLPVTQKPMRIAGGLEPLKALGALYPKINLEVFATKELNNMFNDGEGLAIGVTLDTKVSVMSEQRALEGSFIIHKL